MLRINKHLSTAVEKRRDRAAVAVPSSMWWNNCSGMPGIWRARKLNMTVPFIYSSSIWLAADTPHTVLVFFYSTLTACYSIL